MKHPGILRTAGAFLAIAFLIAGCATTLHPAFTKGKELLAEGQWEQGIAQLEIAAKEDERNYQYRAAIIDARMQAVNELVRQGVALRDAGRFSEAEAAFRRALRIQPEESRALAGITQTAAERRRTAALQEAESLLGKGELRAAEQSVRAVLLESPRNARGLALLKRIEDRKPRPSTVPPALAAAFKRPITLQFRDANLKVILDAISREAGINFVLDRDIRPDLRASIFVQNTPIEEAIESILVTNGLAKKVMSDANVLIYPNTPQKARDYQDLVIRNFYLASADAKQMLTLLRTILKSANIFIDEKRNVLVMRDTPEAIQLAEKLLAAHDQVEPEVMLQVEILEVSRTRASELGLSFPSSVSLGIASPITLQNLNNLDSSGVNITGLQSLVMLNLKKQFGNVNLLANPSIRVRNREKAKIHVGDRVPVIASTVSAVTTLSTQTVNYLDIGIKLEVEPQVLDDEVMLKLTLEVSSLGEPVVVPGASANKIGTRNANTTLTLKDGETQILGGLIRDEEREATTRLPGLGDIPILGRLFSSSKTDTDKTEIILSITPRILRRLERPSADLAEYWSGPETNLRSTVGVPPPTPTPKPPVFKPPAAGVFPGAAVKPAPTPAVPGVPTPVPVPGVIPTPAPALKPIAPAAPATPPPGPFAPPPELIFQPPPGVGG